MATFTFTPSAKKLPNVAAREVVYDIKPGSAVVTIGDKTLPESAVTYLLTYGLKQSLADSYASAEKPDEFGAMLDKRLKKLVDGEMTFREGGSPVDPFESECIRIAIGKLRAIAAKQGKTLPKASDEKFKALVAKVRNGKDKAAIEKEAKRRLAEVESVDASDDIDLSDI